MEGMDADYYVIEYAIRDRLASAVARAQTAALLAQVNAPPRSKNVASRLVALGRALGNGVRRVGAEVSRSLCGRTRLAKHS